MSTLHNFIAAYARPFTLHLLVSSIVLTFALLVSFSTRLTSRTRFAVIAIGVAKFLVPASLFTPLVRRFAPAMPLIVARVAGGAFSVRTPQQTAISVTIIDVIALAWIGIAIILIAATLIVHRRLVHAALRDAATPTQRETSALDAARRRIGIDHGVDIIRSPLCEAPAVLRILRPVVVLPLHGSEPLDDDELESLLAHECAHVARRDNFIALIEALLRAVFWFNPLLWLAHRRLIVEREKACDEIVADTADRAGTYAAAIEKMCDAIINRPVAGVACMAGSNLKERLEHIMSYSSLRTKAISHALAVAFAAILILASTAASAAMLFGNLGPSSSDQPYDVTVTIDKTNDSHFNVAINAAEHAGKRRVWSPVIYVAPDELAETRGSVKIANSNVEFVAASKVSPNGEGVIEIDVLRDGISVQHQTLHARALESGQFTGDPITISLKDADIQEVMQKFSKIAGLTIVMPPDAHETVTINYVQMPWDEALHRVITDAGYTYRVAGKKIIVTK